MVYGPNFISVSREIKNPTIPLLVIWDLENTHIPKDWGINHSDAVKSMKKLLEKSLPNSGIAEIITCANGKYISDEQRDDLTGECVDMKDVSSRSNSADFELMIQTFKWAREHQPPSYIVFITGDGDFYKAIGTVRELGYTTILAYPEDRTSDPLKSAADYTIGFSSLFLGINNFSRIVTRTPYLGGTRFLSAQVQPRVKVVLKAFKTSSTQIEDLGDVFVYWDAVSCHIDVSEHQQAIDFIKKKLETFQKSIKIHVYGNSNNLPATPHPGDMGPTYTQTSHSKEERLESCMLVDILRFSIKQTTHSTIVIITGNKIFANTAWYLRKKGYHVLLVPNGVDRQLIDSAHTLFKWPPPLKTQRRTQRPEGVYKPPAAR